MCDGLCHAVRTACWFETKVVRVWWLLGLFIYNLTFWWTFFKICDPYHRNSYQRSFMSTSKTCYGLCHAVRTTRWSETKVVRVWWLSGLFLSNLTFWWTFFTICDPYHRNSGPEFNSNSGNETTIWYHSKGLSANRDQILWKVAKEFWIESKKSPKPLKTIEITVEQPEIHRNTWIL